MSLLVLIIAGVLATAILSGVRVLREYERGIVFRLGRARPKPLGPGLVLLLPFGVDRMVSVDQRTKVLDIPPQEVITNDNVSVTVDCVVYADVASPQDAVLRVEEYLHATSLLASTTLRAVLGRMVLDELLSKRAEINEEIRMILDERTEQWGIDVTAVEIRDVQLPQEMKRAMARQAEAERERRAKLLMAEGEFQAAERLTQAAALMASQPGAMQLRLYQTLVEVSAERNNTIVFPVPIELLQSGGSANAGTVLGAASAALAQAHAQAKGQVPPPHKAGEVTAGDRSGDRDPERELEALKREIDPARTRR